MHVTAVISMLNESNTHHDVNHIGCECPLLSRFVLAGYHNRKYAHTTLWLSISEQFTGRWVTIVNHVTGIEMWWFQTSGSLMVIEGATGLTCSHKI